MGQINAVFDEDLKKVLKSLGYYDKIVNKEVTCSFCQRTITFANLHAIIPKNNNPKTLSFVCDNLSCLGKTEESE